MRRREPGVRRLVVALAAAVVLHLAVLVPAGYLVPRSDGDGASRRPLSVALYEIGSRVMAPFLYEPDEPIPEGRVVDAPAVDGATAEAPADARFLGDTAQRVGHETQARVRIAGPHRVGPSFAGPPSRSQRPLPGIPLVETTAGPGFGRSPAPRGPETFLAPPGPLEATGQPTAAGQTEDAVPVGPRPAPPHASSPRTDGSDGTWPLPPGDTLTPTFDILSDAVAGTGLDQLDGVEEGNETSLSTRPFAHAGFYRRVRDRVAQYWDVPGAFDHYDPQGTIYGYRDRETLVLVTLDCTGNLVSNILLEESGARFLDELAVDAIAQAAPFHNPPRELCDSRRNIITFSFGFYIETDQGPSLRVRLGR